MQRTQQQQGEAASTAAMSVALVHPALSTDPRILCAAADACKAWREAVQQCAACNTAVQVSLSASLSRLCSFACWLPRHAALVKSIAVKATSSWKRPNQVDGLPWELHQEAAQQLLQQALQLAAVPMAAVAAGQIMAGAAALAGQQQQQRACLPTISRISMECSTGMLAALPAHSLTHLEITELQTSLNGPAVSAALARLTDLQRLRINSYEAPYSCMADVPQLTRLTRLELDSYWSGGQQHLERLLAQPLPLRVLHLRMGAGLPLLDLSHFTQLQEFSCHVHSLPAALFPSELQQLELCTPEISEQVLQAVLQLQRLWRLVYSATGHDSKAEPLQFSHLAKLPALQQLGLTYYSGSQQAAAAAVTWRQLPQLCELSLCYMYPYPSRRQWQAILDGIAASTNLTKLDLHAACSGSGEHHDDEDEDGLGNSFCAKLAGLTNLKHLCISYGVAMLAPGDALALTALTRLTHLNLGFNLAGVGDEAATALAGSCQQLCHLNLRCCNLVSMACLASVAHLTQLTRLWLAGNSGLSQQGLMLLTGLKRLQSLHVDTNAEVTDEVVERLWAAVRGQQL